mmetsp:Transcript_78071/g.135403  ORF Transcript_78071/g.135403 Transcript_78071/m.135403 type:complete len:309 (+) Transcript_78071:97-1023(+)
MADIGASLDLAGASEDEIRQLKREHAIRQREAEFEKKRLEEEERKQLELEAARKEVEDKAEAERVRTMNYLAARARARQEEKRRKEKLDAKREQNIKAKEAAWLEKANKQIQKVIEEHNEYLDSVAERDFEARKRKQAYQDAARAQRDRFYAEREELEIRREEMEADRKTAREVRELVRVDSIKGEAEEELRSFINNPAPVPLKQVLAGRLRPVPKVTELLAAHKDQTEELEELSTADLPMRALLSKRTLFEYIRDIQAEAERNRIKPPEPVVGDMGRGARSKSGGRRSPRSPQSGRKKSPQRKKYTQ